MSKYIDFDDFLWEAANTTRFSRTMVLLNKGLLSFLAAASNCVMGGKDNVIVSEKVKRIGEKYRERFEAHRGEKKYIDALINEMANEIVNNC